MIKFTGERVSNRGGRRPGAGPKAGTGRFSEPTIPIRIPASALADVRVLLAAWERAEKQSGAVSCLVRDDKLRLPDVNGHVGLTRCCEATDLLKHLQAAGTRAKVVHLDPMYRSPKNDGRSGYLLEIKPLLRLACAIGDHVFVWGWPQHVAGLIESWPITHELRTWITWHYTNVPSRIAGWRPSQQTCLHLSRPSENLKPERFFTEEQRKFYVEGRLPYLPCPPDVIVHPNEHGALLRGKAPFPGRKPAKVVERLLTMVVSPGDLVVDPTVGSGTVAVVAAQLGCRAIVGDRSKAALVRTKKELKENHIPFAEPPRRKGAPTVP